MPLRMTSDNRTEGFGGTVQPMNSQISPVEIDYISGLGIDSVAMLVDPSAYTKTSLQDRQGADQAGIDVTQIVIPTGANDYTTQVNEALSSGPDMVYSRRTTPRAYSSRRSLRQPTQRRAAS